MRTSRLRCGGFPAVEPSSTNSYLNREDAKAAKGNKTVIIPQKYPNFTTFASSMRGLVKGIRRADSTFSDGSDVLFLFALLLDNALSGAW